MAKKNTISPNPHVDSHGVEQSSHTSPLLKRVKQVVKKNRKFLDDLPGFDVHAVPGIDKLAAHMTSHPTELQEFHEFCLDWIQALAIRANRSEELLKKAQEDVINQQMDAETERTKRDKEATKLRSRLQNIREEMQVQSARADALESDNVQLKVQLEEAMKNPRLCRQYSKATPGVTEALDSYPVQQELRKSQVVGQRRDINYPTFGDADIADRIRLRNLLDAIQAYFALKANLHVRDGVERFTVVNLSLLWRKELALVPDIPTVRVQKARTLLAESDLDPNARNLLENTAAMEIICSQFSKYRTRGNETHDPLDPAQYETSILRYFFHHLEDPANPDAAALLAMISVPPLLQSQLSAQASYPPQTPHPRTRRRNYTI